MTDTELGKVARDAYYHADNNSVWESIAKAVKEQVLADLHEQDANNPTDPTTWKVGTPVFCWDSARECRVPKMFAEYLPEKHFKFKTQDDYVFYYAELATPEQVAAWHVLNS